MKQIKRWISCLLVCCLVFSMLPRIAFAETTEVAGGTCGESLIWVLTEDGNLTISGSGEMESYGYVSHVPWYRFADKITSVVIENGVTSIGSCAFDSCTNLTSVVIPSGVTSIGNHAFDNCINLASVTIPNSVTSIGVAAFYECYSLTAVAIPDSVTSIGDHAFSMCNNLTSVTIGGSVTSISDFAFSSCHSLTSVIIGNSVINIGYYAFSECYSLTSIAIPRSVSEIEILAFANCSSLTEILFQGNGPTFGASAFYGVTATAYYPESNTTWTSELMQAYSGTITWISYSGEYGGHWYKLITDEMNWIEADEYCKSIGGHLVTITSEGENSFVQSLISEATMIGLSDAAEENTWTWVTGESVVYTNWASNEPNNEANEDYALMRVDGTWNDGHLQREDRGFICEWETLADVNLPNTECTHEWDSGVAIKIETCTEGGERTYTCKLCGETKTELTLPLGHDYVERTCARCGKRDFILAYDVWSFRNYYDEDTFGDASEGYYISNPDYQRLISNLTQTEKQAVLVQETNEEIEKESNGVVSKIKKKLLNYNVDNAFSDDQCIDWGGSCYGMSTWVCLVSNAIRKASDIDDSTATLKQYNCRPEVESAINYYHFQQGLDQVLQVKKEYMRLSQAQQIEILQKLGKQANETGKAFLICFSFCSDFKVDGSCDPATAGGHAVVGYGWEEIEPRTIKVRNTSHAYNYRILIYDCADPSQTTGDMNIYYNDDGIWCIPGWQVVSDDSKTADDWNNNAKLDIVTNKKSVLNGIDYITGECAPMVAVVNLQTAADTSYDISLNGYSANVSGFTVTSETEDHGIVVTVDANITADGKTTPATSTAILPDAESYTVTSENDNMSFSFKNENYLAACSVGSSGNITFLQDGNLSVSADEPAQYYLNLVANDGHHELPWHQIEIAGEATSAVSTEKTDAGILVKSDNLDTIVVAVTDDNGTTEIAGRSDSDAILISQSNGAPSIYEDTDGDGTFETDVTMNVLRGDLNGDGSVNDDDVILLLWHTLLPELYPVEGEADFTADGNVNDEDVIYLLWHTLIPELYPL